MPPASSLQARRRMQSTRQRDTTPEIAIRRVLHARGFRYRVDRPVIPGLRRRADLVFSWIEGCGVRRWLLLALLSEAWNPTEGECQVVGLKARNQSASGFGHEPSPQGVWMARRARVGTRGLQPRQPTELRRL